MRPTSSVLLAIAFATGCAGAGASTGGTAATSPTPARTARGSLNLISTAEIEAAGSDLSNAYDLIRRLRPSMLRDRSSSQTMGFAARGEPGGVVAYVDDTRLGSAERLREVLRSTIREIRYLSASDATTRWGTGHTGGAIQVITRH